MNKLVTRHDLSEYITDFLDNSGRMLNDLLQDSEFNHEIEPAVDLLFWINDQFSTSEHPIGLANPGAVNGLRSLARLIR